MAAGNGGMGRLLGLGFLFGSKDDGATKTAKSVSEGMDSLADATDRAAKGTTGLLRFGHVLDSLNFLQLDRIGGALEGLAEKAGVGPGGAANSIESFGVQFNQTFKQATAGLGKYGAQVRRYKGEIGGAAFNLGIDAGELTQSISLIQKTGSAIEDYGLDVRTIAGSMQAGILSGEQLTDTLTGLSKSYDLGAKGAAKHLDKITALGEMFGVGKEAVQGLGQAMEAADPVLAKFGNLKIDDVTESITRLAIAGQQRLGGKFQDRMQDAINVFNELAGAREQMGELITGLGSDFPELAKEIGIASGDVGASMETILSDPLSFAKNMQKLMSTMDKADPRYQRLKLSLGKLPAGFNFLIQGGEDSAKALEEASKPVKNFEGAFKRMAKGSSGVARTFAESMDLLEEGYEVRLNKMTSQTDRDVIKRQSKAWKRLGDTIDKLRKRGGPFAGILQLALDIRRHGFIHGLIPTIDKLAKNSGPIGKFAKMLQDKLPLFGGFGDAMISVALGAGKMLALFTLVKGPLGGMLSVVTKLPGPLLVIGGLGLLIYKNWDIIAPVIEEIGKVASAMWSEFQDDAENVWKELKNFGKWFMTQLPAMIGSGTEIILKSIAYVKYGIKAMAVKSAASLNFLRLSWDYIGTVIRNKVGGAIDWLTGIFDNFFGFWEVGFMKINRFLIEIPLQFTKFVQSMATKLPKKLVDMLGLEGVTKGIDQTVKYWSEQAETADEELRGRQAMSERLTKDNLAAERKRSAEEAAKLSAIDQELSHYNREMANLELERTQSLIQAEGAGKRVEKGVGNALEERETTAKRRRTAARVQSDRMAASSPHPAARGGAMPQDLDKLMLGIEGAVARGSARGTAAGAEAGIRKGAKRSLKPAEAGGAER